MSKKYSTTTTLVIVESPSKCKKIEQYLGPGYKCVATFGHLRELTSLENIDIPNNFTPTYTIIKKKREQFAYIKKELKHAANNVLLACDNDREGASINYHLCQLLKLDINKTKRIIFNEVTENALQKAIQHPMLINMNEVYAQQARQILDILVGFKISPMIWKNLSELNKKGLSAGRCQTPALRLIYDNDKEIKMCKERNIYETTGYFTNLNLAFELNAEFENEKSVINFLDESIIYSHIFTCSHPIKVFKSPPQPFTTSKLQQAASNKLHYSPKETMRICQILYEEGFITYMRTDSTTYCDDFLESAKTYIECTYSQTLAFVNSSSEKKAHEAIRPTNIYLSDLSEKMDIKERKMYKLIWRNTLESCMSDAFYYSITAKITSINNMKYVYTSERIDFPGWQIVSKKYSNENKEYHYLQQMQQNICIPYKKICSKSTIKGKMLHYTEAKLVNMLEEKGIGRPSTYASLIDKIQERGYVCKKDIKGLNFDCKDVELHDGKISEIISKREIGSEKGKLVIQPLGIAVMEFLEKHFNKLFEYDYTNNMEKALDKISGGEMLWVDLCSKCNNEIDDLILMKSDTLAKLDTLAKSDTSKSDTLAKSDTLIKLGEYNLGVYNKNNVVLRKGKFGLYITCGEITKTLQEFGNRPIENITFADVEKYLEEGCNLIRTINPTMSIRKSKNGDYLFYKNYKMKKPMFKDITSFATDTGEDYKICNIDILKSWIFEKYMI